MAWQGGRVRRVIGKMVQKPFYERPRRTFKKNQLFVTMDYVGPMPVKSADGYTGLITVLVEPYHLALTYPTVTKSGDAQVSVLKDVIKQLKAHVPECRVAFLKTDNAKEYVEGVMKIFCEENDIVQETSVPHQPQQNGKIERLNRTIVDMMRSLREKGNIDANRWDYLAICAAYLRNRCTTQVLDGKTPIEALTGEPGRVDHHRVIGCKAQIYIPADNRDKIHAKARSGYLLGYARGDHYLVLIPDQGEGEVVTVSNAVFYEDQFKSATDKRKVRFDDPRMAVIIQPGGTQTPRPVQILPAAAPQPVGGTAPVPAPATATPVGTAMPPTTCISDSSPEYC
jgi:hypothetical protein